MTPQESRIQESLADLRVLAAEDNEINRKVLSSLLQIFGVEPHIVDDGAEALAAWRLRRYDLILMDLHMPRMDGLTATRLIRKEERLQGWRPVPIIAVTSAADQYERQAHALGLDGVVAKPINLQVLFRTIERTLRAAQKQGESRSFAPRAAG